MSSLALASYSKSYIIDSSRATVYLSPIRTMKPTDEDVTK